MFAALAIERDPLSYANLPAWLFAFCQDAGGFAAFGLTLWVLAYLIGRVSTPRGQAPPTVLAPFSGFVVLGAGPAPPAVGGVNLLLARVAPWLRRLFVA